MGPSSVVDGDGYEISDRVGRGPLRWHEIAPEDATELNLAIRTDIEAPLNEAGERCSWPWEPQQLVGVPMGQYHCPWCGAMVLAGVRHLDYRDT